VLEGAPRNDIDDHAHLRETMDEWRRKSRRAHRAQPGGPSEAAEGVGQELRMHDFQEEFLKFSLAMREQGLPPAQP
jgi:hypothetical protein